MRLFSIYFVIVILSTLSLRGTVSLASNSRSTKHHLTSLKTDTTFKAVNASTLKKENSDANSFYKVNIKENRTDNNFITRLFLPGYKNKNFRNLVLSYQKHLPKPFNEYYALVTEKAFHFPVIFFFISIIIALVGNVVTVIFILLITNLIMNYREKERTRLREFFERVITNMLLRVTTTEETIQILSQPYINEHHNLLIDVLMDFQKSFRGDADRQIIELYQAMDLGRISYNKTFAISFYQQVKGIRELANMHPYHATEMLTNRLNDSNDIVRTEAQICYPHVNLESPFDFLNVLEKPFSHWAQLNIYYFIKIHEMPVPSFDKWMNSRHSNVVHFCIRMIDLFQQQEQAPHILKALNNSEETTRYLAIIACANLHLFDSKETLKQLFNQEQPRNQLEIIKAFQAIGEEDDFPFLNHILQSESIALRLEACRALYNLGDSGRANLDQLNQQMNQVLSPYIAHVKDLRN